MTIQMKRVELTNPDLDARMARHISGQVTWPDLTLSASCSGCAHFADAGKKSGKDKGKGRCLLVKAHMKKSGALFHGKNAHACPKFERGRFL